jgi:hypothetical protein
MRCRKIAYRGGGSGLSGDLLSESSVVLDLALELDGGRLDLGVGGGSLELLVGHGGRVRGREGLSVRELERRWDAGSTGNVVVCLITTLGAMLPWTSSIMVETEEMASYLGRRVPVRHLALRRDSRTKREPAGAVGPFSRDRVQVRAGTVELGRSLPAGHQSNDGKLDLEAGGLSRFDAKLPAIR